MMRQYQTSFLKKKYPKYLSVSYEKKFDLRYGENPHQTSAYYVSTTEEGSMKDFVQLNGKELSFNNIRDMDIAWKVQMNLMKLHAVQ